MIEDLCRNPSHAKSHAELMRAAKIVVEPNTITAHIKAIRDAFRRIDPDFDHLRTERGRGYRWVSVAG
jgi:two-component system, OmpR family, response regulator